jgi:sialate O-acetylesterase
MLHARRPLALVTLLFVSLFIVAPAPADVTLPRILDNNMVLQRNMPLPIWGWAAPGEEVTVSIAGQKVSAKADALGHWQLKLAPLTASSKPLEMKVAGKNTITLTNILVGEVWVCSGQSNMGLSVSQVQNADKELAGADQPFIRLFEAPKVVSPRPTSDIYGRWQPCTPQTVKGFTAAGYFFGLELQKKLDVPIGLINTSWGGTRIEPWTPAEAFADYPKLHDIAEQVATQNEEQTKGLSPLVPAIEAWAKAARAAREHAQPVPPLPALPPSRLTDNSRPTALYNGMVIGLVPFSIRGAIWYQGESNRGEGMLYCEKMKALIAGWRKAWGQGDFPFYYVQLAPYKYDPNIFALPEIWEAQVAALAIPNTGMAVTNDIGTIGNIHPTNKQDVGKRLALWALAKTYGQMGIVYSGPLYKSMKIDGNKIRVSFDHIGTGLASRDGEPLSWFEVAGPDGKFVKADAKTDGDTVVVSSEEVAQPIAVCFAWSQVATPNLMNKEGLPASAFRAGQVPTSQPAPPPK